jgi:hypothetical protein
MVRDLESRLDEELSPLFPGQSALGSCPLPSDGIAYADDQLVFANFPLGVHVFFG